MKRLRIEFGRKSLNLRLGDAQSTGAEGLPHCEIFEVSLAHSDELLLADPYELLKESRTMQPLRLPVPHWFN